MACIHNGEIQTALSLADSMLKLCNPATSLRESRPEMYMQTLCQHYVELIRSKDNLEALYFARSTMRPFMTEFKEAFQLMQPYMPLMAYEKPEESPCFDLLHLSQRADLAQSINGCVMASLANDKSELCTVPVLERILRQLVLVMRRLKGQAWSIASVWHVDDDNDAKMES